MSPADIHVFPSSEPVSAGCNGPTGPCVLEIGHGGDHQSVSELDRLRAENVELQSIARLARIYLSDMYQKRGRDARRALVARINTVMEGR